MLVHLVHCICLCIFMSEPNFEDNGKNKDILMPMTNTKEESSFLLDLVTIENTQLHDETMPVIV